MSSQNSPEIERLFAKAVKLHQQGQLTAALQQYQHILQQQPQHVSALVNIGLVLQALGHGTRAIASLQQACRLAPTNANALSNLGACYQKFGQLPQAITCFEQCIQQHPDYAMAYANLAHVQYHYGHLGAALTHCQTALRLEPSNMVALLNRGLVEINQGNIQAGLDTFAAVLAVEPDNKKAAANRVYASGYSDRLSDEDVVTLHRQWGEQLQHSIAPYVQWKNDKTPQRKLRIGYLSADFHAHPVAYLFLSFLPYHDHNQVEIIAYANLTKTDAITTEIKAHCDQWRDVIGMNDQTLAQTIYHDQIDILIDLGGHTANNRLPVLAYKPAPIQACYLGYPMTTGLQAVDYLIVDKTVCPPESAHLYIEQLAYLPQSVFCFRPHAFAPDVSELPAQKKGYITFGCYNNLPKITPSVIVLWSQILTAIPTARLILKSRPFADRDTRQHYQQLFIENGVDLARIELRGPSPHPIMLAELAEIDVALDPFPFGGGATTLETLWQGVPVITLCGTRFSQRMTSSLLTTLQLTEWVATSNDEYIAIAKRVAKQIDDLAILRQALRHKMAHSILCDGKTFARQLQTLYQQWWQNWCAT